MKKTTTFFKMMLLAVVMMAGSVSAWGQTGTLTITRDNFPAGSLVYGTDDLWSATTSTGEVITGYFDLYSTVGQTNMQTRTNTPIGSYPHNTVALPGAVTKITLVGAGTGTARAWTPYLATTALTKANYAAEGTTQGSKTATDNAASTEWIVEPSSGYKYFYLNMTGGAAYLNSIVIEYQVSGTPVTAAPTFTPPSGTYTTAQNVELASATTGAKIYYTTDGSDPSSTNGTLYSAAIPVSTTTTIKAIAYDADGANPSSVTSATYTFPPKVADIAAFLSTAETGEVAITGTVTVVYQNGQNLYVQDASGSLLVYGSTGKTFANGDQLTGLMGKLGTYGDSPQMTNPVAPDAVSGTAVDPVTFNLANVTTSDLAKYVKVEGVQFAADVTFSTTATVNGTLVDPSGFVVRDNFRLGGTYTAGKNYDIVGFISYFNGTAQLFPVTITEVATTTPAIFATPTSVSLSATVGDPAVTQEITVTGNNLTAGITVTVEGAQFAVSPATLDAAGGTLTVTYTPSAAATTHTGTLTLSSTGAENVVIALNGETEEPLTTVGDGTEMNPFTVEDVMNLGNTLGTETKYWVTGYIVGAVKGGGSGVLTTVEFENFTTNSAIALADTQFETDLSKMIPVQLPAGSVRTALNLVENSSLINKQVRVFGTLEAYFTVPGVKNTTDYYIYPLTGLSSSKLSDAHAWTSNGKIMLQASAGETIEVFNVAGQKVASRLAADGLNSIDVSAKGVVIVKVSNRVSKVIL